jgi:NADPH:quinone reductase-like Zn-dependent oxidoreductase
MNAAVLHDFDQPPRFEQFPEPTAEENEVIVHVQAAALKPVDKQVASGLHYASPGKLPVVCGIDGVGRLEDGARVYFGGPRSPFGAMAQLTAVSRPRCFPLPQGLDDVTAAAVMNPGVSAWLTLAQRAKLVRGETVLVLGATGATGKLAVQIAKLLGAARVVAAGRNEQVLSTLHDFGADATIGIDKPGQDLSMRSPARPPIPALTSSLTICGVSQPKLCWQPSRARNSPWSSRRSVWCKLGRARARLSHFRPRCYAVHR